MDLNTLWFVLIFVLLTGYAVLDGFDLGVGALHFFARGEEERRVSINAIAPVWDGNEVWLLAGGGSLFAAFPQVYATVFSGFYTALMLLLACLIFRAVSLEFRGKVQSPGWKRAWDLAFALGSTVAAVLLGVAIGNVLVGLPIDAEHRFTGSFFTLLNPFALAVGVLGLVIFTFHGALYLCMKCGDAHRARIERLLLPLWMLLLVLWLAVTLLAPLLAPALVEAKLKHPMFLLFMLLTLAGLIGSAFFGIGKSKKFGRAFVASTLTIVGLMGLAALGLFPNLAPSTLGTGTSLTIYNSSSTPRTLRTMFIIALIGMPFVLGYTAFIYTQFKGKVVLDEDSY